MGILKEIWDLEIDPDDPVSGYTPYSFLPSGNRGIANMSLGRDWARKPVLISLPMADGVLDANGLGAGSIAQRDMAFSFRSFVTNGDLDAVYDSIAGLIAPGIPKRLVYETDSGALWFTIGYNARITNTLVSENKGNIDDYIDITLTWTIRPDWRWRYPESQGAKYSPFNNETYSPLNNELYAPSGTFAVTSNQFGFTLDATGTLGYDRPTVPDYGATISAIGPLGGDDGIRIWNLSDAVHDTSRNRVQPYFDIPVKLPTANDSISINLAKGTVLWSTLSGAFYIRLVKPNYQTFYFRVLNGIVNNGRIDALGANPVHGGGLGFGFWRKRA